MYDTGCQDVIGVLVWLFSFLMVVQQPYSRDFTFTSVAAKTAVRLWCMERQTYRTIITNKSKKRREQLMGFLKT